jgi:hypothetical protein
VSRSQHTVINRIAVADVAVAMGPRNQRRVATSGLALGVIVVVAGAALLLRPSSNPGPAATNASTQAHTPTFVTEQIVYGMSKAVVLRRIGKPTKIVGACWQYDENEKIRGGANFLNAERVCFLSGIYSYAYSEVDNHWTYPTDPINLPHPVG